MFSVLSVTPSAQDTYLVYKTIHNDKLLFCVLEEKDVMYELGKVIFFFCFTLQLGLSAGD